MEAIAKTRHLKGSPRKARLVIDLIRGRNVSQALAILKFTDKRAADPIEKTLRSAIANATFQAEKQNIAVDPDDLFVKTCFVDMGAHKNRSRMRPAPQGRAFREHRHYCHITILVSSDLPIAGDDEKSKRKANLAAGKKTSGGNRKSKTSVKGTAKADGAIEEKKTKKASVKETKKSKDEGLVENSVENPTVEAPIVINDPVALAEGTGGEILTEAVETNEPTINPAKTEATNEAEAANAKDTTTQRTAELHETSMADEAQLDRNEELERQ